MKPYVLFSLFTTFFVACVVPTWQASAGSQSHSTSTHQTAETAELKQSVIKHLTDAVTKFEQILFKDAAELPDEGHEKRHGHPGQSSSHEPSDRSPSRHSLTASGIKPMSPSASKQARKQMRIMEESAQQPSDPLEGQHTPPCHVHRERPLGKTSARSGRFSRADRLRLKELRSKTKEEGLTRMEKKEMKSLLKKRKNLSASSRQSRMRTPCHKKGKKLSHRDVKNLRRSSNQASRKMDHHGEVRHGQSKKAHRPARRDAQKIPQEKYSQARQGRLGRTGRRRFACHKISVCKRVQHHLVSHKE